MPALPPLERLLVVSPHLDDGVFACGQLLAAHPGSTVLTVFAGAPADEEMRTEWDQRCGFRSSRDAIDARREEDREALALLGARPVWLSFIDSQYHATPTAEDIESALIACVDTLTCEALLVPMGLFHSDHSLVHEACLNAVRARPERLWLAYEDALYRRIPGLLQQRLLALAQADICATPAFPARSGALTDKQRAVMAYASQLRAFGANGYSDVLASEHYWRLSLPQDSRPPCAMPPAAAARQCLPSKEPLRAV